MQTELSTTSRRYAAESTNAHPSKLDNFRLVRCGIIVRTTGRSRPAGSRANQLQEERRLKMESTERSVKNEESAPTSTAVEAESRSPPVVSARQRAHKASKRTAVAPVLVVLLVSLGAAFLSLQELRAPDFLRNMGLVDKTATFLTHLHPRSQAAPLAAFALAVVVSGNQESQEAVVRAGAVEAAVEILQQGRSGFRRRLTLAALEELLGNNDARNAFAAQGGVDAVINVFREDVSEALTARSAKVLAVFAADSSSARKKAAAKAGTVSALLEYMEGGASANSRSFVNAAWALANLAADSTHVQAILLEAGGPELLAKLLRSRNTKIIQPATYGAGNLAAKNRAAQQALRETGALKALVRLIQAAVEGRKLKASEPFRAEILEHLAELQRTDPAVRTALSEVGGLEEILSIVEAGTSIRAPTSDKQLVAVEDSEDEDSLHSVRRLVRDLQDEVDSETGLLADVRVPSLSRTPPSGARVLHSLMQRSRQGVASEAAWALGLLVGANADCQDAAREAGAVEALIKLLEAAEDTFVIKGTLSAITSLVKGNAKNKAAVRAAHGVEGLVKLLASNPADKEVLKATAHALKFMSAERPTYEVLQRSGARWFRVFGRQGSDLLLEVAGLQIPPLVVSALVTGICTAVVVALVSVYVPSLMSGGGGHGTPS